ncbi:hypothetical protein evm_005426 [Chilo suppressalis]|nr:hypothetical protein evm_005426 [Chilo suppressalis]
MPASVGSIVVNIMKCFVVLVFLLSLLSIALGEFVDVDARVADYTSNYAELAAPVPSNVNVHNLVASLLRYAHPEAACGAGQAC